MFYGLMLQQRLAWSGETVNMGLCTYVYVGEGCSCNWQMPMTVQNGRVSRLRQE